MIGKAVEKADRPQTARQVQEKEEWVELCCKASFAGSLTREDGQGGRGSDTSLFLEREMEQRGRQGQSG